MRPFRLAALAAAAALAGLVTAAPGAAKPLPAADVQAIDGLVAQQMAAKGIPGVTVSVRAPGKGTFLRSYGLADTATGRPLAPGDAYRIASVTKSFTATAILLLADEGRLRLSDRLERYVPGIPNGRRITIRQVLAMRGGIFDYVADPQLLAAYTANPLLPGFRPEDVVAIIARNAGKAQPPGVGTVYSNSDYALLGLVIQKVTGQPAERYINRRVVRPLGLTHTRFPSSPALPTPFSHGYDDSAGALRDATFSSVKVPWTSGAMVSTVPDMTRYASLLADGALLTPRTQRARLRVTPHRRDLALLRGLRPGDHQDRPLDRPRRLDLRLQRLRLPPAVEGRDGRRDGQPRRHQQRPGDRHLVRDRPAPLPRLVPGHGGPGAADALPAGLLAPPWPGSSSTSTAPSSTSPRWATTCCTRRCSPR